MAKYTVSTRFVFNEPSGGRRHLGDMTLDLSTGTLLDAFRINGELLDRMKKIPGISNVEVYFVSEISHEEKSTDEEVTQ